MTLAMGTNSAAAYLRTKVMSARPEELRLLLLEGAAKFARQAREGLAGKDYESSYTGLTSCRAIVLELMSSIRVEIDPDLADRVRSLYSFVYSELIAIGSERNIPRLDKVIELLDYERETWTLLMAKLADERAASPGSSPEAPASGSISVSA